MGVAEFTTQRRPQSRRRQRFDPMQLGLCAAGALACAAPTIVLVAARAEALNVAVSGFSVALGAAAVGIASRRMPGGQGPWRFGFDAPPVSAPVDADQAHESGAAPAGDPDLATGLPTRAAFVAELQAALSGPGEREAGLAVIHLKDFERLALSDARAAQAVLRTFAARLALTVQPAQPLCRLEGAAFAVWLPQAGEGAEAAEAVCKTLRVLAYVLGQEIREGPVRFTPEVRVGAALYPRHGRDVAELVRHAEAAVLTADSDITPVALFDAARRKVELEDYSLKQDLRGAIDRDELLLHFQPVVDLAAGRVRGAEALLRWRRLGGELVLPGRFIPMLENSTMIEEVGLWTLNAACRQARAWEDAGLHDLRIAVNFSARQFRDPMLISVVARTLELHRVAPQSIEIELTETAAMQDATHTRRLLDSLHELGVGVAIDDFGAGYSSMSYLKNLRFTKLKIDREFVADVDTHANSRAICKALVELARGLGIEIVAEGVERREEVETLLGLGCPLFQGFYFSRPLAAEDFASRVGDPDWLALLASPVHRQVAELRRAVGAGA